MKTELTFNDGGKLYAEYDGEKDGSVIFTAETNEGLDRLRDVTFMTTDGSVKVERTVFQEGKREEFTDYDFILSDGGTFNVLKKEYEQIF